MSCNDCFSNAGLPGGSGPLQEGHPNGPQLSGRGAVGPRPLLCQAQQSREGQTVLPEGLGPGPQLCGCPGGPGGAGPQHEEAREHQERRPETVARLQNRHHQPHGAQPPRQPLLLQTGMLIIR